MSHRIVDAQVAIRFPQKILVDSIKELGVDFYGDDQYLLVELGGDNNMFEEHPLDRKRQIRSRDWSVLAFGDKYDVMRKVRDRFMRFGLEYVEAALAAQGRRLVVVDEGETGDDIVRDMHEVLVSMCARLYGKRSAKNRAQRALAAAAMEDGQP